MSEITQLGVKAIRDGVAGGEFTAREAGDLRHGFAGD